MKNNYLYLFKKLTQSKNRKSLPTILFEFLHLSFIRKEIATYYFTGFAYVKNIDYRKYRSHRKLMHTSIFESEDKTVIDDKGLFMEWAKRHGVTTPKSIVINKSDGIENKLGMLSSKDIFLKPLYNFGGNKCYKLENSNDNEIKEFIQKKYSENEPILVQELVNQHDFTKKLNSSSLNTIRVHTLNNNGRIRIISAYMRIGKKGNEVDNIAQGGYLCKVDIDSWKLEEICVTHFPRNPEILKIEKLTEFKLTSLMIPFKKESQNLIFKAAKSIQAPLIGWDLAITEDGPLIIEGNTEPEMNYLQYSVGGFENDLGLYEFLKSKVNERGAISW